MLISLLIGIVLWPLLEYLIHRFLGHTLSLKTKFKIEHGAHHARKDYFAPIPFKVMAALPVITVMFFVCWLISTLEYAVGFTLAFAITYSSYEYFHHSFHVRGPKNKLGAILRKHHFAHHFMDPKVNHGVTTRVFDRVFGTHTDFEKVIVPKNMAMEWLWEDKENLIIKEEYRRDYHIKGQPLVKSAS